MERVGIVNNVLNVILKAQSLHIRIRLLEPPLPVRIYDIMTRFGDDQQRKGNMCVLVVYYLVFLLEE